MKNPPRYLLTWRSGSDFDWHQRLYTRLPEANWVCPFLLENLETGTVLITNFDLRQQARFATTKWPLRNRVLRQWERFRNQPSPEQQRQQEQQRQLAHALAREKQWQRKARLAATKLRQIRTRIQRLRKLTSP